MDVALQRRRLIIALAITGLSVGVALAAAVCAFGFHIGWMKWVMFAAVVVGFGSHIWLMLGVLREKAP